MIIETAPIVVGVVAEGSVPALTEAIDAGGASAEALTEATALVKASAVDALVFDVGSTPERLHPIASALAADARTRWLPRLVVVSADVPATALVPFGPVLIAAGDPRSGVDELLAQVAAQRTAETLARRTDADRRAAERMLESLKNGAGTLAHDARALFGLILGVAGNMRDGFSGTISSEQRAQLVNIVDASNDAASLLDRYVTDIRHTMEPPSGGPSSTPRTPPRRQQNDLSDLVRATVALFERAAIDKRIRLAADAPRANLAWCDAMLVKQALVNLIANALKFSPEGGTVTVSARSAPPAPHREGAAARREVELAVVDSGPGIPEADRTRIFERGVRLDRDRNRPGSGIGLSVVRDVVEQHGGSVRIEAGDAGGAAFVLTLPTDLRTRADDRRFSNGSIPAPLHREGDRQ